MFVECDHRAFLQKSVHDIRAICDGLFLIIAGLLLVSAGLVPIVSGQV